MSRENTFSFEEEFALYRFIIKNGKKVEYDSVTKYFGEGIYQLARECKRHEYLKTTSEPKIINGYIAITKLGLKRYRKRHYFFFLRFLRSVLSFLKYQKPIVKLNKESKRHITIVVLMILTIIVMVWLAYKQGILKFE